MACSRMSRANRRKRAAASFCAASRSTDPEFLLNLSGDDMAIKRYVVEGGKGTGGQHLPFARAVEADGWLHVSGQVPMVNGELVTGNIVVQSEQAIQNLLSILTEAG